MKTEIAYNNDGNLLSTFFPKVIQSHLNVIQGSVNSTALPEILFITSYPPRECGIATYSQDLVKALDNQFNHSFKISLCPLESENEKHDYTEEIKYVLNTDHPNSFTRLAKTINENDEISIVMIQHEFGFFAKSENEFKEFLDSLIKPVIIVFHTVLPNPDESMKIKVQQIASVAESIIVMTNSSSKILTEVYAVANEKISVIPHGTHLVPHLNKDLLKVKYNLKGKKILSTFGLLSSGKSIETTLEALPEIVKSNPDVVFLIIGKTHPSVVKQEGYQYRNMLDAMVVKLKLQNHVQYLNYYLPLPELLDYLQLTDIYLFTSKDPNQAVSGTFSYAMSCGCPIISTPIPHAREVLSEGAGIIFDFQNSTQLSQSVNLLLNDESLRQSFRANTLHQIVPTAWENSAIAHAQLFRKIAIDINASDEELFLTEKISLQYRLPEISLKHVKKMTTDFGIIQFSKINQPDIDSGYTLDDNARALIAMCMHYEISGEESDLSVIRTYLNFIKYCQQPEGYFLNYVDSDKTFTEQNNSTNLADANGRAIWALGFMISKSELFQPSLIATAKEIMEKALQNIMSIHSTRAMAFVIKGVYLYNSEIKSERNLSVIECFAQRLANMYQHENDKQWQWFESYLTYGNSILSEAMLYAYLITGNLQYKKIATESFAFLLSHTFSNGKIKVISNKSWLHKGQATENFGEQPIDVAYTILALSKFHEVFFDEDYLNKMEIAFSWFLGNNHLHQIIYNPCTGGCYDGLEETHVNLNQGAESTLSYLMARLTIENNINYNHSLSNNNQMQVVESV